MGGIRQGVRCLAYPTAPPLAVTNSDLNALMFSFVNFLVAKVIGLDVDSDFEEENKHMNGK